MLHLRTSTLEEFRRCSSTTWGDEEALIARLMRGQWEDGPSNWKMDAGTAWHRALATGDHPPFKRGDVAAARAFIGPGLCEVSADRLFLVDGCPIRVFGTADHVCGLKVQDHKTKFSPCDPGDYEDSLQWRFYLLLQECNIFQYNLFRFKVKGEDWQNGELQEVYDFRFYRYPELESDCHLWLSNFLHWLRTKHLTHFVAVDNRVLEAV